MQSLIKAEPIFRSREKTEESVKFLSREDPEWTYELQETENKLGLVTLAVFDEEKIFLGFL